VQWHPAGDFLATTSADGSTKIWDFRDQRCAWTLKAHEGSVNCAAFTADGSTFACGGSDGIVTLWKSGFNRSFENVVLAEKQTHDKKYQVENEEDAKRTKRTREGDAHHHHRRRRLPPKSPPPDHLLSMMGHLSRRRSKKSNLLLLSRRLRNTRNSPKPYDAPSVNSTC
jgi:WD40 repeat protein